MNGSGSLALTVPRNSMEHSTSTRTASITPSAGGHGLLRGPQETWVRKRGRLVLEGVRETSTCTNWPKAVSGGHVPSTRGRESPDSDMSSSGSDVSINKGIKRMRLDHHNKQQHQQQYQQQQDRPPPSVFGLVSSEQGSRSSLPWGAVEDAAAGAIDALRRQPAGAAPDAGNPRFIDNAAGPIASPMPLHQSSIIPAAVHHPRLVSILERSSSSGLSSMDNTANEPIMARSASAGVLQPGLGGSGPHEPFGNAGNHSGRPAHSDRCAEFAPFAPRPPTLAQYVRGIRVQADAPADVDYSNVNHALRQLHMERKMMAAARDAAGSGAEAGRQGLGQTRYSPR